MSKLEIGDKVQIEWKKKSDEILTKEFNPMGAPKSDAWYYTLKSDPYHFFREDYLISINLLSNPYKSNTTQLTLF